MILILASLFRQSQPAPWSDKDMLGEYLRGASLADVAPEVLLRIL